MNGSFRRIIHWGPLIALAIINLVSLTTIKCSLLWWPPLLYIFVPETYRTLGGAANLLLFLLLSGLTVYFFLNAMFIGPGHVQSNWKPEEYFNIEHFTKHEYFIIKKQFHIDTLDITKLLQLCQICKNYKAPRAHHCRKCNRCILKMDHHCPWINNCVGHDNHAFFVCFLFFATTASLQATMVIICSLYQALNIKSYIHYGNPNMPIVYFTVNEFLLCFISLGLAVGVFFSVGALCIIQLKCIVRNRTGIEDWIIEKARYRRIRLRNRCLAEEELIPDFTYPYNLGALKNITQVFTISCQPVGDGLNWEIQDGCSQFSLTLEQLLQKKEKLQRTREYAVIRDYSGSKFPITFGLKTCTHPPCTDDPRIPLVINDFVKVTRWKNYWLYGEKVSKCEESVKGWFPRKCVIGKVDFSHEKTG